MVEEKKSFMTSEELDRRKRESAALRKEFMGRLQRKELTFEQFVKFAQQDQYKALRAVRVYQILSKMPGWSNNLAKRALITMGMNPNISIRNIVKNERHQQQVSNLMLATSSNWQDRRKAPQGFPWYGNLMDTLVEIYQDGYELPHEAHNAVRYYADSAGVILENEDGDASLESLFSSEDQGASVTGNTTGDESSDDADGVSEDETLESLLNEYDEQDSEGEMIDLEDLMGE